MLIISTPPIFTNYFEISLACEGSAPVVWHIPITEYFVLAVLHFLDTAGHGAARVAILYSGIDGKGCGISVFSQSGVCCEVDNIDFLEIIRGCSLGLVAS